MRATGCASARSATPGTATCTPPWSSPTRARTPSHAHRAFDDIFEAAIALGGTITGEHGVGLAKLPYLERRLGAGHMALLRRIKSAFDPQGILNPGKLGS